MKHQWLRVVCNAWWNQKSKWGRIGQVTRLEPILLRDAWVYSEMDREQCNNVLVILGRECGRQTEAEIQQLLVYHASDSNAIIYTGGSVLHWKYSRWGFTSRVFGRTVEEHRAGFMQSQRPAGGCNWRLELLQSHDLQTLIISKLL